MKTRFVYRIDDVHPAMMWDRFWDVMALMEKHNVIPLLGLIPDNQDTSLMFEAPHPDCDTMIRTLVDTGRVEICQHGYQHVYTTRQRSVNQLLYGRGSNSEFAGLPYEKQVQMIKKGKEILRLRGFETDIWMAPSHTHDRNTFRALRELGFKYVTDGISLYPYTRSGLLFVPQQVWRPKPEFPFHFGVYTICLHLNDLTDQRLHEIESHLKGGHHIIPFSEAAAIPELRIHKVFNVLFKMKRLTSHRLIKPCRVFKKRLMGSQLANQQNRTAK